MKVFNETDINDGIQELQKIVDEMDTALLFKDYDLLKVLSEKAKELSTNIVDEIIE